MASFTPRPFMAGKPSSFKGFRQTPEKTTNSQTLPPGLPGLSGDILRQSIASMHNKSSLKVANKPGNSQKSPSSFIKQTAQRAVPMVTSKDIMNRRDSMNRAPPPLTPDAAKFKTEKTPEFLRKKLKPTGKVLAEGEKENVSKKDSENKEEKVSEDKDQKSNANGSNFRNSQLMFQNFSAAPVVAPKPKSRSFLAANSLPENEQDKNVSQPQVNDTPVAKEPLDTEEVNEESDNASPAVEDITEACSLVSESQVEEVVAPKQWPKPEFFSLPDIPVRLSEWIKIFVVGNAKLLKLDKEEETFTPAINAMMPAAPIEDEIYDDVENQNAVGGAINGIEQKAADPRATEELAEGKEELYDDVDSPGAPVQEELYDDITPNAAVVADEIYDDVDADQPVAVELYDDVGGNVPPVNEEIYDDISGNDPPPAEELYDDVGTQQIPSQSDEIGEAEQEEDLYEPVETIAQYITSADARGSSNASSRSESPPSSQNNDKANKKKEEKERKERERIEKKRKEETDKKLKKEEEERKKREKEEKKRVEKERKSFNLKPDEDPIPIERHMTTCDFKGKGKDLAFVRSEYVDIITKNNCPKGKWLAQNNTGKLGYVSTKDLGVDQRKSLLESASPVALGVAFGEEFYEEVTSQTEIQPLIMSLASRPSFNTSSSANKRLSHFTKSPAPSVTLNEANESSNGDAPGEEIYEMVS